MSSSMSQRDITRLRAVIDTNQDGLIDFRDLANAGTVFPCKPIFAPLSCSHLVLVSRPCRCLFAFSEVCVQESLWHGLQIAEPIEQLGMMGG